MKGRLLLTVVTAFSLGFHWLALQLVAWMGMMVTYAAADGLPAGLRKTFDGEHPCALCQIAAKGVEKKTPASESQVVWSGKLEPAEPSETPILWRVVTIFHEVLEPRALDGLGRERPSVPPPRVVA